MIDKGIIRSVSATIYEMVNDIIEDSKNPHVVEAMVMASEELEEIYDHAERHVNVDTGAMLRHVASAVHRIRKEVSV